MSDNGISCSFYNIAKATRLYNCLFNDNDCINVFLKIKALILKIMQTIAKIFNSNLSQIVLKLLVY
ncbi:Uncharacterised protein [Chlamydia trachomatis]|nr:Uncharacterised protein [Chlamydia trachomatis]